MNSFESLGVQSCFIEKLKERSIVKPTAIQSLVLPRLLEGKNILFRSETGTGKTFAYLLPVLQLTMNNEQLTMDNKDIKNQFLHSPQVLICAPTLELCVQIKGEIDFLLADNYPLITTNLLIGSVNIDKQIESLKKTKPAVVIGNPSRLLVLAKMGKLKFNSLRFLILDEADRLTANECLEDTKELLAVIERASRRKTAKDDSKRETVCSAERTLQVAACSATVSKKTGAKLGKLFENAEIIESDDNEILRERIEHWALFSEKRRKVQTLRSLLAALKTKSSNRSQKSKKKALVFTSRGDEAALVLSRLQHHHVSAAGLFGKVNKKPLSGKERMEALGLFREGKIDVLVSTDLAARGLDIPGITHVIALDVPQDTEAYIHRCGRTGRAGKRGIMVTIGDETQMRLLALMEKKLKIRINPKELYEGRVCVPEII